MLAHVSEVISLAIIERGVMKDGGCDGQVMGRGQWRAMKVGDG